MSEEPTELSPAEPVDQFVDLYQDMAEVSKKIERKGEIDRRIAEHQAEIGRLSTEKNDINSELTVKQVTLDAKQAQWINARHDLKQDADQREKTLREHEAIVEEKMEKVREIESKESEVKAKEEELEKKAKDLDAREKAIKEKEAKPADEDLTGEDENLHPVKDEDLSDFAPLSDGGPAQHETEAQAKEKEMQAPSEAPKPNVGADQAVATEKNPSATQGTVTTMGSLHNAEDKNK